MLEIRPQISERNGMRVKVFRRHERRGKKSEHYKKIYEYELLGSFLLAVGYSDDLIKRLEPEEVLALKNWVADMLFLKHFDSEKLDTSDLTKISLRLPSQFVEVLQDIHFEAKKHNIEFIPHQVMLEALLKNATLLQSKLDKLNGSDSGFLERMGLCAKVPLKQAESESINHDKMLFKALLELDQPISKTCAELEKAAYKLGKNKRIPPTELKDWAGVLKGRSSTKPIKKWCFAIAIEVLMDHEIDPINLIGASRVAYYWAIQQQDHYTLKAAMKKFIELFQVKDEKKEEAKEAILTVYSKLKGTDV